MTGQRAAKLRYRIPVERQHTMREKCLYSEFFWAAFGEEERYGEKIQKNTGYLSVFSPNAGKY